MRENRGSFFKDLPSEKKGRESRQSALIGHDRKGKKERERCWPARQLVEREVVHQLQSGGGHEGEKNKRARKQAEEIDRMPLCALRRWGPGKEGMMI